MIEPRKPQTRGSKSDIPAAGHFVSVRGANPEPGRAYLVAADYGNGRTYDVAFLEGRHRDGSLWWIVANVDIYPGNITHYAEINRLPE